MLKEWRCFPHLCLLTVLPPQLLQVLVQSPGTAPPDRAPADWAAPGACHSPGAEVLLHPKLFEVLKESEEDLTRDDETGPERCTAQSRDQIRLPSKEIWKTARAVMPWWVENEQPEAIHAQRAADAAEQQLSTSFCSLSMMYFSRDFPIHKKEIFL